VLQILSASTVIFNGIQAEHCAWTDFLLSFSAALVLWFGSFGALPKHSGMKVGKSGKRLTGEAYAYILQFNEFCQSSSACIADRWNMEL